MPGLNISRRLPEFKRGDEQFHRRGNSDGFTVGDYWQWMGSDLLSNLQRGVLAEFIVARILNDTYHCRHEWDSFDVQTEDLETLEVKSAAHVQSWHLAHPDEYKPSEIRFRIAPKKSTERRAANGYVFCVLGNPYEIPDPLDLTQWVFYAITTNALDKQCPKQLSIGLRSLQKLNELYTANYHELPVVVKEMFRRDPLKGELIRPDTS
ncbi:MAG: hypothetical protein OXI63_24810 [Candidatus Poribacteria bacterium]|nr:hypothetical protein [Candidatus Poribacteria bacterium]